MRAQPRWPVVVGAVVGAGLAAVGVASVLGEAHDTHPAVTARWVVGLALAHDLLVAPLVCAVGAAVARWAPARPRPYVAGALLVSGVLATVAWPLVRGYGRVQGNPSILPRNYGRGLLVALVTTWVVTAVLAQVVHRRARAREHERGGRPPRAGTVAKS